MKGKVRRIALLALVLLCFAAAASAQQPEYEKTHQERALLIGVDEFVTQPSVYPSSTNNVLAMQEMFQYSLYPLEVLMIPDAPVATLDGLTRLIQETFAGSAPEDVNYLYISTHGVYDPEKGIQPGLVFSDGTEETIVSPQELEAAFEGIAGTKVLIVDACNSGAFIGKGMAQPPETVAFQREDFKVLTSSGAMEQSWYWSSTSEENREQGSFYFTQALCDALGPASSYPADQNQDGNVTLREIYDYLMRNHAASTPQVYPQNDSFVIFRYDRKEQLPAGNLRSPIMDVTFSDTILDRVHNQITIEFIAVRPVRVAYQLVYQREGRWEFEKAQLIYDEAERPATFGNQAGMVSAGWKQRTLNLQNLAKDSHGYALVQLLSVEQGKLRIHAGRVICVSPPAEGRSLKVRVPEKFSPPAGEELAIFIAHDYPCALSVAVIDEEGKVVHRLCHRRSTRPMGIPEGGTTLYWDGRGKDDSLVQPGVYRIRAQAVLSDGTITEVSETFVLE